MYLHYLEDLGKRSGGTWEAECGESESIVAESQE